MSALMRLIALLFGLGHAAAIAAIHLDDAGRQVDIASPPQRIITIAPNVVKAARAILVASITGFTSTPSGPMMITATGRPADPPPPPLPPPPPPRDSWRCGRAPSSPDTSSSVEGVPKPRPPPNPPPALTSLAVMIM